MATGVNATRVEVFRNTSGSPSSTVDNVDNNDRARRAKTFKRAVCSRVIEQTEMG